MERASVRIETCRECFEQFEVRSRGRAPNRCYNCKPQASSTTSGADVLRIKRDTIFASAFDGPRCECGHLAFLHHDGALQCLVDRCRCSHVSHEPDPRWASAATVGRSLVEFTLRRLRKPTNATK